MEEEKDLTFMCAQIGEVLVEEYGKEHAVSFIDSKLKGLSEALELVEQSGWNPGLKMNLAAQLDFWNQVKKPLMPKPVLTKEFFKSLDITPKKG